MFDSVEFIQLQTFAPGLSAGVARYRISATVAKTAFEGEEKMTYIMVRFVLSISEMLVYMAELAQLGFLAGFRTLQHWIISKAWEVVEIGSWILRCIFLKCGGGGGGARFQSSEEMNCSYHFDINA